MKKKYNLIFWMAMACLIYAVFSWFVPIADISSGEVVANGVSPIGIFDLFYYPVLAISSYITLGLIVLAIGGFYGVMSKTGAYSKLVESFVQKLKGKEKLFLGLTVAILAVINSVLGLPFVLLIVVPFLMAVILKLGYNKLTAVTATIGSILVGGLGSTFGSEVAGYFKRMMNIEILDAMLWKVILLVISVALLVCFVLTTAKINSKKITTEKKSKATKSSKTKKSDTIAEVKEAEKVIEEEEILFLDKNEDNKKKRVLPIIIVFTLTIFFAILSTYNWNGIFGLKIFDSIYELISKTRIPDNISILSNYANLDIITKFLGIDSSFGNWTYLELIVLIMLGSLLVGWIYNLKFKDTFEGFVLGAKKMIKPAIYVCLANTILIFTLYAGGAYSFFYVADKILPTEYNAVSLVGTSLLGSLLSNDFYFVVSLFSEMLNMLPYASEIYPFIAFVIQAIYGVVMLFLPTSVILVCGLSMLDVSYKDWMKHIWKLLVELFLASLALIIMFSIIL